MLRYIVMACMVMACIVMGLLSAVSVVGLNFAVDDATATAVLGPSLCRTAAWTSSTLVRCSAAAGGGLDLGVRVTVASFVATLDSLAITK